MGLITKEGHSMIATVKSVSQVEIASAYRNVSGGAVSVENGCIHIGLWRPMKLRQYHKRALSKGNPETNDSTCLKCRP